MNSVPQPKEHFVREWFKQQINLTVVYNDPLT